MPNIKSSLKKIHIPRISRNRAVILVALAIVIVGGGAVTGVHFLRDDGKEDAKEVAALITNLDKEPDCNKSLEQLNAIQFENLSDKGGQKLDSVEKITYYKIHCNNTLENYIGALVAAQQLKAYYEQTNADQAKKRQIDQMIESIKQSRETKQQDEINDKAVPEEASESLL